MQIALGHALLIITLLAAVALHALWAARRQFPDNGPRQIGFCVIAAGILIAGSTVSLLASLLVPERVVYGDAVRYYYEILSIAEAPWLWNPLDGTGPYGYDKTPKMGMSYLYGVILGVYQATGLPGVLALNIAALYVTAYSVFLLTLRISGSGTAAAVGMAIVGVYPETLFWVIRPARENITLPLVTLAAYGGIRLFDTGRARWLAGLAVITVALLLTRAQLVLFVGIVFTYYGVVVAGRVFFRGSLSGAGIVAISLIAAAAAIPYATDQIRAAAGNAVIHVIVSLDPIGMLAELGEGGGGDGIRLLPSGYGAAGLLMLPLVAGTVALAAGTLFRFTRIFRGAVVPAGMVLVMVGAFLAMLTLLGGVSLRFRSAIAPLLIALLAPGAVYYWRVLALPSIALPTKRVAA